MQNACLKIPQSTESSFTDFCNFCGSFLPLHFSALIGYIFLFAYVWACMYVFV